MCETNDLNNVGHFVKYLAKLFSMQTIFSVNYNFIIVIPEQRIISSSNVFLSSCSLNIFLKMLPSTSFVVRGLRL